MATVGLCSNSSMIVLFNKIFVLVSVKETIILDLFH
jgi:hypothetical protein